MAKKGMLGLGTRLLLFIIPVSIGSLVVSSFITAFYANRSVERATNSLLEYKAEDLVRHIDSQWDLLLENQLHTNEAYLASLERSTTDYALTMLRSEGEWIFAVDAAGMSVFSVGAPAVDVVYADAVAEFRPLSGKDLRIDGDFAGAPRVGFGFNIASLGWDVYITDLRATYYADPRVLWINTAFMVTLTVTVASIFVVLFIKRSLKPLRTVVSDMHRIVELRDFGNRVDPIQNDEVGELAREFNQMSDYLERAMSRLHDAVNQEAEARHEIWEREVEALEVLSRVSEYRDTETARHISRVGVYASLLSRLQGDSLEESELMLRAVPLHDIGKVGIRESILQKEGELNSRERKDMESHVQIGYEILKESQSPILRAGADIVLSHHERWDGSGYPAGLKGHDIPARGRITGLVDVFDALVTRRPYKEAWSLEKAVKWIRERSGVLFDPQLVELFFSDLDVIRDIMEDYSDEGIEDAAARERPKSGDRRGLSSS